MTLKDKDFCKKNWQLWFAATVLIILLTAVWAIMDTSESKRYAGGRRLLPHAAAHTAVVPARARTSPGFTGPAVPRNNRNSSSNMRLVAGANLTPVKTVNDIPLTGNFFNRSHMQVDFNRVAESVKPVVVCISAVRQQNTQQMLLPQNTARFVDPFQNIAGQETIGSGIIISRDGYILTNWHVVANSRDIHVGLLGNPGNLHPARIIKKDAFLDLALLEIVPNEPLTAAWLGNSDTVRLGDWVIAMGNSFGFQQTVTAGIISAERQQLNIEGRIYRDMFQTDAPINKGNSGGPLVNMNGEIIGINTAIYAPTGVYSGVGFAIPVNQARAFVEEALSLNSIKQTPLPGRPAGLLEKMSGLAAPAKLFSSQTRQWADKMTAVNLQNLSPQAGLLAGGTPCPYCDGILDAQGRCPVPGCPLYSPQYGSGNPPNGGMVVAQVQAVPGSLCPYCDGILDARGRCPVPGCPLYSPQYSGNSYLPNAGIAAMQTAPGYSFCPPRNFNGNYQGLVNLIPAAAVVKNSAYLGVVLGEVTADLSGQLDLPGQGGLIVNDIVDGSPASVVGISKGDVIISFQGCRVETLADMESVLATLNPGDRVRVEVVSMKKRRVFYPVLGSMGSQAVTLPVATAVNLAASAKTQQEPLGIEVRPLLGDMYRKYAIPETVLGGVVIDSVIPGQRGARSGLAAGDLVVGINRKTVRNISDYYNMVRNLDISKGMLFDVVRNGYPVYVAVS